MKKYRKLNVKIGVFFLILVILVAIGMGALVYNVNYSGAMEFSTTQLIKYGNYINDSIDSAMVDTMLKDSDDAYHIYDGYKAYYDEFDEYDAEVNYYNDDEAYNIYTLTFMELRGVQEELDITHICVYLPCMDENGEVTEEAVILYDLNYSVLVERELGDHVKRYKEYKLIKEMFRTGEPQTTDMFSAEENGGRQLTSLVPLKRATGAPYGVILVACRMDTVHENALQASIMMIIFAVVIIVAFANILLIFLQHRVIRPIKLLSERMNHFVTNGNEFTNSHVTEIRTRDELENLADNFNSMADSIISYTSDLKQVTASQERLRAELDVAGGIRSAISAEITYPAFTERSDFDLCASMKNTVYNSCSFCNYFLTDEDHLLIVLGESVGKTLPSMLMSMLASTNISALARMHVEPYKIAYDTNNSLCGFERNDMSMTVSALIARIDLKNGIMTYVNAGMPPMILKRPGEQYIADTEDIQFNLGEMHGVSFEQKSIQISQGTTMFFTSYGVAEIKNADGEKFTLPRVTAALNGISSHTYPLNEMIDELERGLDDFGSGVPRELDTTILGFRYLR